mgnify:CR=1 FL=1
MPSRSGGEKQSEPYRLLTARVLRHAADSVMKIRQTPYLIIMGDFNDYPESRSVCRTLGAGKPEKDIDSYRLYNLMNGKQGGNHTRYRGEWGQFLESAPYSKKKSEKCGKSSLNMHTTLAVQRKN